MEIQIDLPTKRDYKTFWSKHKNIIIRIILLITFSLIVLYVVHYSFKSIGLEIV